MIPLNPNPNPTPPSNPNRGYATMINKNNEPNQEFSIQKEEFPALGDATQTNAAQANPSKTAVTEFQEQQAVHSRQAQDQMDLIGKSLRKQVAGKPLLNGSGNGPGPGPGLGSGPGPGPSPNMNDRTSMPPPNLPHQMSAPNHPPASISDNMLSGANSHLSGSHSSGSHLSNGHPNDNHMNRQTDLSMGPPHSHGNMNGINIQGIQGGMNMHPNHLQSQMSNHSSLSNPRSLSPNSNVIGVLLM